MKTARMASDEMKPAHHRKRLPMMKILILSIGIAAVAASAVVATPAWAGPKDKKKGGGPIELEEIVIEGRVQKPQAFYILQRSNFGFKVMDLRTEYLEDIEDSVKDEVF